MKGAFNYRASETVQGVFNVIWLFSAVMVPAILWKAEWVISGTVLCAISWLALCCMLFLKGHYTADEEGVTLVVPFRRYRFRYDDIRMVKTSHRDGGHSRIDDTMSIVTELAIYTDSGTYRVNSSKDFSMNEQLGNTRNFEKKLSELELVQLGNYIKAKIN